ncbi:MAG: putative Zn-dependent protease [Myxococcota bacterium]|jgi:predicted Zn-dependent protease
MSASFTMLSALLLAGCTKLPYTQRRQLNVVPENFMNELGVTAYREVRQSSGILTSGDDVDRMRRITGDISAVTGRDDYVWRSTLFEDDDVVNAWCMPGGKIGFYTGILPVLENEAGMAFVMGHEVAHAVMKHGAERMSQQLVALGGLTALGLYIDNRTELEPRQSQLILAVLGLGAQVGIMLPFSRLHESEADQVGLMFMARAGYPPQEAIAVWDRMEASSGGGLSIEFLSTHPSYDTRRENLRGLMTRADKRYEANRSKRTGTGDPLAAVWSGNR